MDNLGFLKQILMSDTHYWIVARQEYALGYGNLKRQDDSIWFIALPDKLINRKKYEEITLADIEMLNLMNVHNIALTDDYPPFQYGISMYNIYKGGPVPEAKGIKQVMIDAVNLKSKDFYEYKKLTEVIQEKNKNE